MVVAGPGGHALADGALGSGRGGLLALLGCLLLALAGAAVSSWLIPAPRHSNALLLTPTGFAGFAVLAASAPLARTARFVGATLRPGAPADRRLSQRVAHRVTAPGRSQLALLFGLSLLPLSMRSPLRTVNEYGSPAIYFRVVQTVASG